jgi:uncharacterized protein
VKCNIQCQYCYQNPQRDAGNVAKEYDLEAMKRAITREGGPFVLFGGEPLLMPEDDLEELWKWGFEQYGANRIQTNAVLINDRHMRMFRDYGVHVGISVDGPDQLNDARWTATLDHTRRATAKTHRAIEQLCQDGIIPTLIVTLHRANATKENLPRMLEWFRHLERLGVRNVRLHILEVESGAVRDKYALSDAEVLEALTVFMRFEAEELRSLRFDLFAELRNLLLGRDENSSCVWNACDPYTTEAVRGIEGQGQSSNCGRTNKDGIDFVKADHAGFERAVALYRTDQSALGCKDCRFFLMCKGQCPGTSANGDWRNRSDYCSVWMGLFERVETQLLAEGLEPISLSPCREQLEAHFIESWRSGHNTIMAHALKELDRAPPVAPAGNNNSAPSTARTVRVSWVSDGARMVWENRLRGVAAAMSRLNWLSVKHGLRRCSMESIASTDVDAMLAQWRDHGLNAEAIGVEFFPRRPYYDGEDGGAADNVIRIRFAVGRSAEDVAACRNALKRDDHASLADLFGYPSCCARSFQQGAGQSAPSDHIWQMAAAADPSPARAQEADVAGPPEANIICRPLGIQAVPHVPCGFDCEATAALGRRFVELGHELGYAAEMDWLLDLLDMPMDWSSLHGIAEVRMPLLKMAAQAVPVASLYRVRREGATHPDEGGVGLAFPFKSHRGIPLTKSRGYRRGLQNPIQENAETPDWLATDNGFLSVSDMHAAHRPIIDLAKATLAGRSGGIIDLGCGNGFLLSSICAANPGLVPFGIDRDPERIKNARLLLAGSQRNFVAGDLFDDEHLWTTSRQYACGILMAARLLEVDVERAASLRRRIQSHCDTLLVYAYADAIARWGTLETIAGKAGLRLRNLGEKASIARFESR